MQEGQEELFHHDIVMLRYAQLFCKKTKQPKHNKQCNVETYTEFYFKAYSSQVMTILKIGKKNKKNKKKERKRE
jgi:hypothetical protein